MRWSIRRVLAGLIGVGLLTSLVVLSDGQAQGQLKKADVKPAAGAQPQGPNPPAAPPPPDAADLPGATLPTDPKLKRKLEAAQDYIKTHEWAQVAKTIQELLDLPQDVFVVEQTADGKPTANLVGIRVAANRLLGTLPRNKPGEGIDVYNTLHGANARKILQDALAGGDKMLFADVAHRYLYTDAGGEAAERLGTLLLDRGDFTAAAQAFERLIQRDGIEKLEPMTLFKAALAFHRAGDREGKEKEKVWKQLTARAPDGLRLNDQTFSLDDLQKHLERYRPSTVFAYDYPQFGGNESRNAQASKGDAPFMVHRWRQPLTVESQVMSWIYDGPASAVRRLEERGHAVLPATFPIAATMNRPKDGQQITALVFRTYRGLSAVNLKTGSLEWRSESSWSLEKMQADTSKSPALHQWVGYYKDQNGKPGVLLENSTLGSLSTDGARVYAVEDLAVPPSVVPQYDPRFGGMQPGMGGNSFPQAVNDAMHHNELQAIELATGKLKWSLGGKRPAAEPDRKDPKDLLDSYFLGPPLCLGGKLYFLNEKQQDLRLVCLDPNRIVGDTEQEKHDAVVWVQTLCTAKAKMLEDYSRRTSAAHVAFAEGILVCPTNAGVLLGVDILSHSLVWAHPYRDPNAAPQPATDDQQQMLMRMGGRIPRGMQPNAAVTQSDWKTAAPVVADGRVVFTAPDGGEIRCLNLRNGAKLWGHKRGDDDLYLAGVWAGRAVVVGKKAVRSLALEDGKELWRVETGFPSGRGAASDNVYYVPLREFIFPDKAKAPAVVAIDVATGKVVSQTRSRPVIDPDNNKSMVPVPGNLIFFDGDVISQNAVEVVAYPQLATKLRHMDELLAKNPKDSTGLFERGELRLDQGNRLGAVQDLRDALANEAPPEVAGRARAKMYEAMTELLQHDFKNGKPFLKDYEALCRVDVDPLAEPAKRDEQKAEGQRRRARYLALYARGMQSEGSLTEALNGYLEYAALGAQTKEMLEVVDDRAVRAPADVWARGQIAAMLAAAPAEQREPLEKAIAVRYAEARDGADLDKLRNFVTLFGSSLPVGREARLLLAGRLVEQEGKVHLLEAERNLLLLEQEAGDRVMAARAVDELARLQTRLAQILDRPEMYEDAAHYYRVLRDRYGDVVVRDGKTGAQLHQELANDRRFLLYMEEPTAPRAKKVSATDQTGSFPQTQQQQMFTFEPVGETLPFFRRHRLAVGVGGTNQFEMDERRAADEKNKWSEPLRSASPQMFIQYMANANASGQGVRFGYQSVGHLLVLNLGSSLAALDPINRKLLWEKSLFGDHGPPTGGTLSLDANDGSLRLTFTDNYYTTLGQAGPVAASYVCLQTKQGLIALDPLTGRTLWERGDVPSRCRVFGDDAHVYLVEMDTAGAPTGTRAFRAHDGAAVVVPNFAAAYKNRQRVIGRTLLTSETSPATGLTLKLHDVHTGKDLWSKSYPAGSVLLRSEEADLVGAVSPEGRASVVSLAARKEVVVGVVDPKDMQNVQAAHLLSDGDLVYVAFHVVNPQARPWGGGNIQSNLLGTTGLRGLTVNGKVYAFNRRTSKIAWVYDVQDQQLVLEQWKEMPVLLFTGRYMKLQDLGGGRWMNNGNQLVAVQGIIKANGKLALHKENLGQQTQQFHAINNDVRGGKIEMISPNYKVTFNVEDGAAATKAPAAPGDSGGR